MDVVRHIQIDDFALTTIERGFKGGIVLDAFPLLSGMVGIPALVAVGHRAGPTVMAVAGVHGNEYEGQEAVRDVFERIAPGEFGGRYVAIPVCNVFAYEARTRSTPPHLDGLNLARVFPGRAAGSPTVRLAHALMGLVTRNLGSDDLFIDFHSASEDSNYLPMVGFRDIPSAGRQASEEAARHFGGCPLWRFGNQTGMFNAEVSRAGIPTVGTETTGQAGCRPKDVRAFSDGLWNLLRYRRMVEEPPPPRDAGPARTGVEVPAEATGFLRAFHRLGADVEAGQPLGEIIDPFGERLAEVRAPCAGRIFMQRTTPAVRAGEVACILGVPAG